MEKKVIKVDFANKKKIEDAEEPKDTQVREKMQTLIDKMGEKNNPLALFMKLAISGQLHEKIEKIKRNTDEFSPEVYKQRTQAIQSYSDDQIFHFITESDASEWHKDPAFYRALVDHVAERLSEIIKMEE